MEYMESMMNNRLEASMSEYEQMANRIAQLEQELAAQAQQVDCPACKEHDQLGCPTAGTGVYTQPTQEPVNNSHDLADKCKVAASCLTYNESEAEAVAKHLLLEASQALRRSQAQEPESKWISVEDRLPKINETVALLNIDRWMNTGSDEHSVNWHGTGYLSHFGHDYWTVFGESRAMCLDAVTHWMPLPPAPEGESK